MATGTLPRPCLCVILCSCCCSRTPFASSRALAPLSLPPNWAQPEDVEHWVAAHGLQAAPAADGSGGSGGSTGGAATAAGLYGTSPLARFRALTRTYLGSLPALGGVRG